MPLLFIFALEYTIRWGNVEEGDNLEDLIIDVR
jgi:hypothetical protein